MATKQEKLKQLTDEVLQKKAEIDRTMYYDDFVKAFKALMEYVDKARNSLITVFDEKGAVLDNKLAEAVKTIEIMKGKLESHHTDMVRKMESDNRTFQRMIRQQLDDEIPEAYDDEELATKLDLLQTAFNALDIPEKFDATELQTQVETNTKDIEELKKRPIGKINGGMTDAQVKATLMRSIQAVTPTGVIDGANDTFEVPSTIHAIFSFELNSRVVSLGEYTIAGSYRKTIVFDSAIPASYSGKSFVVTYI